MSTKNSEYIELKFGPHWKYISTARGFIQSFIAISLGDEEKADKVAVAASELLENAVKYSSNAETLMRLEVHPDENLVKIVARNPAKEDAVKNLAELFDKVNTGEALEAYVTQMKESALRDDGKSQLGLVRIRYEAGGKLSLDTENGVVTITAEL